MFLPVYFRYVIILKNYYICGKSFKNEADDTNVKTFHPMKLIFKI